MRRARLLVVVGLVPLIAAFAANVPAKAKASPVDRHRSRPIVTVGMSQSLNWSGYNQGILEPNGGGQHVAVGTFPTYNSTPATSGPHWNQAGVAPMSWGVYTTAVPEPAVVHNLEHGGIVIWYQASKLSADDVAKLTDFVNAQVHTSEFKFILSPWTGKDFGHPIAVTAWRYLLYLDTADTDGIRAFADLHYGKSPEPLGGPAQPA